MAMTCRRSSVFTAVMLAWLRDACEMEASTGKQCCVEYDGLSQYVLFGVLGELFYLLQPAGFHDVHACP